MRCMVGLSSGGCRGMGRGCVVVGNLKGMVKSSGGVVSGVFFFWFG